MRLTVVLVGARNPWNIGAAARAMRDFGFDDLRVVNEYAPPFEAAQIDARANSGDRAQSGGEVLGTKAAVGAAAVLDQARRFDRLIDAIEDCTLVAGTTAIGERGLARTVLSLQEAAPQLLAVLNAPDAKGPEPRVALLFGSEKTGLTNEQLSHCQVLLTIPMFAPEGERHLSMNLGQAVAVCLYELVRGGFEGARELPAPSPHSTVTAGTRERLTDMLLRAMQATGYARRFPANSREPVVRLLAQRLGGNEDEAVTWIGFLRQVERSAGKTAPQESESQA